MDTLKQMDLTTKFINTMYHFIENNKNCFIFAFELKSVNPPEIWHK